MVANQVESANADSHPHRHGGGTRTREIVRFLDDHMTDAVVLTEFRKNSAGRQITDYLESIGLQWSAPNVGSAMQNTVLIAARKLNPRSLLSPPNDWSIHSANVDGLNILGLSYPRRLSRHLYTADSRRQLAHGSSVMVGDFNTGLNDLDVQGRSNFWCEADFRLLSTQLMVDAYRAKNGDAKEYSWYSRAGNGFRVDHALITSDLKPSLASAKYLHESRNGASDHSALMIEFDKPCA